MCILGTNFSCTVNSQNIRRQLRQIGALPFLELDVRGDRVRAEFADDVIESVR